ncbi:hypothetical protein EDB85DRAFT_2199373 [Lactarius pseudohatsudake]|nr:hypothetical protein EDB85DRAFT_2199373 [Lactarius pseudohatsudake]
MSCVPSTCTCGVTVLNTAKFHGVLRKQFQKSLEKQGLQFKLSTKMLSAEKKDGKVLVSTEATKDRKKDSLEADVVLVAVGLDSRGRVVMTTSSTSVPNIKSIGDVTFGLMLAHAAEEEGITAVEYIHSGHGHVNYGTIPSVVYTHARGCVGQEDGARTQDEPRKLQDRPVPVPRQLVGQDEPGHGGPVEVPRRGGDGPHPVLFSVFGIELVVSWLQVLILGDDRRGRAGAQIRGERRGYCTHDTRAAHPTLSEAFREAALQVSSGNAIHF